jgi:hypothetical protein
MPDINASSLPEKPDLAQERKRPKETLRDGDRQPFTAYYDDQLSKACALCERLSRR